MKKLYLSFSFLCVLLLSSCGHDELPSPKVESSLFSWHNLNASIVNNVLAISGQVLGNIENLSLITLEVQAITEDCLACPFIAEYSETYYPVGLLNTESGVFSINYLLLNRNASEYRWRLSGSNYVLGLKPVVSPVYLTKRDKIEEKIDIKIEHIEITK